METEDPLVEDLMNVLIAEKQAILLEIVGLVGLIMEDLEDLIGEMMIRDRGLGLQEGKNEVLGPQEEKIVMIMIVMILEEKDEVMRKVMKEINLGLLVDREKEMLTLPMNLAVRIKISRLVNRRVR